MKLKLSLIFILAFSFIFAQKDPAVIITDGSGGTGSSFNCGNYPAGNLTLSASNLSLKTTENYSVAANTSFTPYPYTAGNKLNVSAQHNNFKYLVQDLPFKFCFYGNTFTQIALGTAGLITFDTSYLNSGKNAIFPKFSQTVPSPVLPPGNAIFGAYQEGLVFDDANGSDVYTQTVGAAPFRKFVITYYNGVRTSFNSAVDCSGQRSTTQIVLHETTNAIDIYADIPDPKLCAGSPYQNSLIGIQNAAGTAGMAAPGRNSGAWAANKEAYTFAPAGTDILPTSIVWKDGSGAVLGNTNSIMVPAAKAGTYTATESYTLCSGDASFSGDYTVTIDANLAAAIDDTEIVCQGSSFSTTFNDLRTKLTTQNPDNFNFTFTDNATGAVLGYNDIPVVGHTYNVTISSKNIPGCTSSSKLKIISSALVSPVHLCADLKSGYNLSDFTKIIVDANYTGQITYYLASDPTNPISSLSIPAAVTQTDLLVQLPGCSKQPITIIWDPTESSKAVNSEIFFCYPANNPDPFVINDLAGNSTYIAKMQSTAAHWFFLNYNDAALPKTQMDYTKAITGVSVPVPQQPVWYVSGMPVWVRFEDGNCFTVKPLQLTLINPSVLATKPMPVCDFKNDGTEDVTLSDTPGTSIFNYFFGNESIKVKYFSDAGYTNDITNKTITVAGLKTVYVEMQSTLTFVDGAACVKRGQISFQLSQLPVVSSPITVNLTNACDHNANGYEIFDATTKQGDIYSGTDAVTFNYFYNYNATTDTFTNEISDPIHIKISGGQPVTIFVKVTNANGCYSVSQIQVSYQFATGAIKLHDALLVECSTQSTTTFNLDEAIAQMFLQSENSQQFSSLNITYYQNYDAQSETPVGAPIASNYSLSQYASYDVYAKFTDPSGCYSVAKINLKVYPEPVGKTANLTYCQYDGLTLAGTEGEQLFQASTYFPGAPYVYTFYDHDPALGSANILDASAVIYPQNLPVPNHVWYKIKLDSPNNPNACSTSGDIIFTASAPISVNDPGLLQYCDTSNDLKETIDLTNVETIIKTQYPNATFLYYNTFPTQPIASPKSYSYDAQNPGTIFVKVSDASGCPQLVQLNINLKKTPKFTVASPLFFCQDSESIIISPNYDTTVINGLTITNYHWILPDGSTLDGNYPYLENVKTAGTYTLTITADNGCDYTSSFELKPYAKPKIYKIVVEDKTVKVLATSENNITNTILYQMDGGAWQTSYIFENVAPGVHYFAVSYQGINCRSAYEQALVLKGNNVITPNGDGINDRFTVTDLNIFGQKSSLQIFDRYGKLLYEQSSGDTLQWDGTYLQRPVETGTYWYILKIGDGRELTGWILVKNE